MLNINKETPAQTRQCSSDRQPAKKQVKQKKPDVNVTSSYCFILFFKKGRCIQRMHPIAKDFDQDVDTYLRHKSNSQMVNLFFGQNLCRGSRCKFWNFLPGRLYIDFLTKKLQAEQISEKFDFLKNIFSKLFFCYRKGDAIEAYFTLSCIDQICW